MAKNVLGTDNLIFSMFGSPLTTAHQHALPTAPSHFSSIGHRSHLPHRHNIAMFNLETFFATLQTQLNSVHCVIVINTKFD